MTGDAPPLRPDVDGGSPPAPSGPAAVTRTPWYRRRAVLLTVGVAAVVAVAVVTDLPQHTSRANQISDARSVLHQVDTDIAPCGYALKETLTIYRDETGHSLSTADRASAPGLLSQDQTACSFTNESIFDLSDIEVPGTASGHQLGAIIDIVTLWTTSDALGAIEAVQTLGASPSDAKAKAQLERDERLMASDRHSALDALGRVDRMLGATLPTLALPAVTDPAGGH